MSAHLPPSFSAASIVLMSPEPQPHVAAMRSVFATSQL
jgi:hypothetical protein